MRHPSFSTSLSLAFLLIAACDSSSSHSVPNLLQADSDEKNFEVRLSENLVISSSLSDNERERRVEELVNAFTMQLGEQCQRQNEELRTSHIMPCPNFSDCPVDLIHKENGRALNLSLSVSEIRNRISIYASITFRWTSKTESIGVCYHPRLMPITAEFERSIRSAIVGMHPDDT